MQTQTHYNLQQLMMPTAQKKLLRAINHALDNPTLGQRKLVDAYSPVINGVKLNPFDYFRLGRRSSHRNYNHDFFMAMMIGFQLGGYQGMSVGLMHVYQDFIADMMKHQYGKAYRDGWESVVNYYFALAGAKKQQRMQQQYQNLF